jgi:hypothetical protein
MGDGVYGLTCHYSYRYRRIHVDMNDYEALNVKGEIKKSLTIVCARLTERGMALSSEPVSQPVSHAASW